ncbi:phiSA1p31-related protein [Streptomyces sp. NPDC005907]|uniref:phiSA1p31-related protein n=1 Tax=Streptomyces sp. NPDC005907 TaxID=3154571 RepID=UPI00340B84C1
MTTTFKPGDKVEHRTVGTGEIAFGPFEHYRGSETYLMKEGDTARHVIVLGEALTKPAKFKVGDTVRSAFGRVYTVEAGPFFAPGEWYALKSVESGNVVHSSADEVRPVVPAPADESIKAGDVVRIPRNDLQGADVKAGDLLVVKRLEYGTVVTHTAPGARTDEWYFDPSNLERVSADDVAVHDGVVYDLKSRYRDNDGDYWTFKRLDDDVRGYCVSTNIDRSSFITSYADTLEYVVRNYGPLTRVDA